jgi:hypothetical protein
MHNTVNIVPNTCADKNKQRLAHPGKHTVHSVYNILALQQVVSNIRIFHDLTTEPCNPNRYGHKLNTNK